MLSRLKFVSFLSIVVLLTACGQQAVTPETNAPVATTPEPVKDTMGGVIEGTQFTPPANAISTINDGKLTAQANVNCYAWTYKGTAQAICTITSGQARVRADCVWAPDLYSPWTGKGTWSMWTGKCPWGIRSAIIETRY